jgi:phage head maturation protease
VITVRLAGIALPFGEVAWIGADRRFETVTPGAFAQMLQSRRWVELKFGGHDLDRPHMASSLDQSLRLFEAPIGLCFSATVRLTQHNIWMLKEIVHGRFNFASVSFTRTVRNSVVLNGHPISQIRKAEVSHVAIVNAPAYASTVVWRDDVPLDAAPERIRAAAEQWHRAYDAWQRRAA